MDFVPIIHGRAFTVFAPRVGQSDLLTQYVRALDDESEQDRRIAYMNRMAERGPSHGQTRYRVLGDRIFEVKPQPHRILCFYAPDLRGAIVVATVFRKRSRKTPGREIQRAVGIREEWIRFRRLRNG